MRRIFTDIYATKAWGECESVSGPGSTRERAAAFLPDLIRLVSRLRVSTLLDAPSPVSDNQSSFRWTA